MEVKVDIVTSDEIKIYYTGKFQYFTARYIINVVLIRIFKGESRTVTTATLMKVNVTLNFEGSSTFHGEFPFQIW